MDTANKETFNKVTELFNDYLNYLTEEYLKREQEQYPNIKTDYRDFQELGKTAAILVNSHIEFRKRNYEY